MNKVRSKGSKGFSGRNREFKRFSGRKQVISEKKKVFMEIARDFPAEIANSSVFSGRKQVISKKKTSPSQKRHKIWCQSTKNTNLDLDLRSRSPDPVNFFGAQSSLGEHNFRLAGHKHSVGGARPRYAPPWRRVCCQVFLYKTLEWKFIFCYRKTKKDTNCLLFCTNKCVRKQGSFLLQEWIKSNISLII